MSVDNNSPGKESIMLMIFVNFRHMIMISQNNCKMPQSEVWLLIFRPLKAD